MKKEIIIYTNSSCPYCKQIKELLEENKIKYIERDKEEFAQEWYKVVELTGIPVFPTVNIGDEYILPNRDYQHSEQLVNIIEYLTSDNYKEWDIQLRIHEKLKTINFNMGNQFSHIGAAINSIKQNTKTKKEK
tara:strand:- start:46 stop:444 length:399 start_codon:yes stop_codon:yes gene_type:complete